MNSDYYYYCFVVVVDDAFFVVLLLKLEKRNMTSDITFIVLQGSIVVLTKRILFFICHPAF